MLHLHQIAFKNIRISTLRYITLLTQRYFIHSKSSVSLTSFLYIYITFYSSISIHNTTQFKSSKQNIIGIRKHFITSIFLRNQAYFNIHTTYAKRQQKTASKFSRHNGNEQQKQQISWQVSKCGNSNT